MNTDMTIYQSTLPFKGSSEVALFFRNHQITHKQFNQRVDKYADILFNLGIRKDDVVSILSPNIPECIITYYALNKIGAIAAFLHPLIPSNLLKEAMIESKSKYFIVIDLFYNKYKCVSEQLGIKTFLFSVDEDLNFIEKVVYHIKNKKDLKNISDNLYIYKNNSEKANFEINTDYNKPSVYLRSGGTTGKSKTIVLSDKQLLYPGSLASWITDSKLDGKTIIGFLPLFHGFGLAMGVIAPLMNNASSLLMVKFDLKEVIKNIKKDHLHVLIFIPYLVKKILDSGKFKGKYLKNLIATFCGADKTPSYIIDEYDNLMKQYDSQAVLLEGYGLTETVTVTFVNTLKNNKKGSVGKPLLGTKFKIVNEDNLEDDIGSNNTGLILIASPALCIGYLNDKDPFYIDKNGEKWLITGDIGYHDDEGYLFFSNRKKDVYKIAGYNVFPSQIEEIASSFDEVTFACCIFINDEKHPYLKLFVELNKDKEIDKEKLKNQIKEKLESSLIKYSVPEKIILLDELPRTNIGKIDKKKLVEYK